MLRPPATQSHGHSLSGHLGHQQQTGAGTLCSLVAQEVTSSMFKHLTLDQTTQL